MAGFFEQQEVCSLYACLLIGNFRIVHDPPGTLWKTPQTGIWAASTRETCGG